MQHFLVLTGNGPPDRRGRGEISPFFTHSGCATVMPDKLKILISVSAVHYPFSSTSHCDVWNVIWFFFWKSFGQFSSSKGDKFSFIYTKWGEGFRSQPHNGVKHRVARPSAAKVFSGLRRSTYILYLFSHYTFISHRARFPSDRVLLPTSRPDWTAGGLAPVRTLPYNLASPPAVLISHIRGLCSSERRRGFRRSLGIPPDYGSSSLIRDHWESKGATQRSHKGAHKTPVSCEVHNSILIGYTLCLIYLIYSSFQ